MRMARPLRPVAVLTGVTVPEMALTTNAVCPDDLNATAVGEYPTGMSRPATAEPRVAAIGVTVSESPPTAYTVVLSGATATALVACPAGTGRPARRLATLMGVTVE